MTFFEKLHKVFDGVFPIVSVLLSALFPQVAVLPIVTKVVSSLPLLMDTAQEVYGPGKGEEKKQAVLEAAQLITRDMIDISTGGQKETWQRIEPVISPLIDAIKEGTKAIGSPIFSDSEVTAANEAFEIAKIEISRN